MSIAKHDLQVLANTADRALYTRIKVQHPQWFDELINKEIENLRSTEFAEWYEELLKKVENENRK